jgi:hypothetical protein
LVGHDGYSFENEVRDVSEQNAHLSSVPNFLISRDLWCWRSWRIAKNPKKADVGEHIEMFPHVGLLFNEPPGRAGLSFT